MPRTRRRVSPDLSLDLSLHLSLSNLFDLISVNLNPCRLTERVELRSRDMENFFLPSSLFSPSSPSSSLCSFPLGNKKSKGLEERNSTKTVIQKRRKKKKKMLAPLCLIVRKLGTETSVGVWKRIKRFMFVAKQNNNNNNNNNNNKIKQIQKRNKKQQHINKIKIRKRQQQQQQQQQFPSVAHQRHLCQKCTTAHRICTQL